MSEFRDEIIFLILLNPIERSELSTELIVGGFPQPNTFSLSRIRAHVVVARLLASFLASVLFCRPSAEIIRQACRRVSLVKNVAIVAALHLLPVPAATPVRRHRACVSFTRKEGCEVRAASEAHAVVLVPLAVLCGSASGLFAVHERARFATEGSRNPLAVSSADAPVDGVMLFAFFDAGSSDPTAVAFAFALLGTVHGEVRAIAAAVGFVLPFTSDVFAGVLIGVVELAPLNAGDAEPVAVVITDARDAIGAGTAELDASAVRPTAIRVSDTILASKLRVEDGTSIQAETRRRGIAFGMEAAAGATVAIEENSARAATRSVTPNALIRIAESSIGDVLALDEARRGDRIPHASVRVDLGIAGGLGKSIHGEAVFDALGSGPVARCGDLARRGSVHEGTLGATDRRKSGIGDAAVDTGGGRSGRAHGGVVGRAAADAAVLES